MTETAENEHCSEPHITVHQPQKTFSKFFFWKGWTRPPEIRHRKVVPNHLLPPDLPLKQNPNYGYRNNVIRTTKYTFLSFIPKNLFEQFHRFANLYFLGIVLLNWVPQINAFGKEIAMIPVIFVLAVTAIKDAYEDKRRHISDKRVNNDTCRIYNKEADRYIKILWKKLKVGDIVHLSCNEVIPADILLLRSSDDQGLCYIETSNLDGENNLKQRKVVQGYSSRGDDFHPTMFQSTVECDPPNYKIYRFNGCICNPDGQRISINKDNLLLRECVLKNTDFVEGIVVYAGHDTKAMLNNGGPRYKRSKLEKFMNRDVIWCIVILFILCFSGSLGSGLWLSSFTLRSLVPFIPDTSDTPYPLSLESFFTFWTFVIILQVMIPLSLYVTIELIKLGQVYLIHVDSELYDIKSNKRLECRALNITEELGQVEYIFSDKTGTLTENQMVFRRCTIGGVDYRHHHPSMSCDMKLGYKGIPSCSTDKKNSEFIVNPKLQEELSKMEIQLQSDSNAKEIHLSRENQRIQDFFLLLAVCNTVIVSKHPHKDQMNASGLFLNSPKAVSYRYDAGEGFNFVEKYLPPSNYTDPHTPSSSVTSSPNQRPQHLAIPEVSPQTVTPTSTPSEFRPIYEAESPDEIALVEAAYMYNCRLIRRVPGTAVMSLPGEGLIEFSVLHVLPFDAVRKRMSVILEHPFTGEKVLYCKGADTTVLTQLAPTDSPEMKKLIMKTQQHLNDFSRRGLRILCMAKKVISQEEYDEWACLHKEAELAFDDREQLLYNSACLIETNLELLGATGIEDRLQEGVPETLAALRAAGIVVWVLTGDKQETAVNIAYSCRLFATDMEIITLNARSQRATEDTIQFYLDLIERDLASGTGSPTSSIGSSSSSLIGSYLFGSNNSNHSLVTRNVSHRRHKRALVIDGHTLNYVLDKQLDKAFLNLAQHCIAVLCCRATPLQKASLVKLVKDSLNALTLAIGDGANDVSMIQTADVGVGISGQEGMQAVMASDFALARFRYLERLLLVHGHWCYERLSRTILYFLYKNASFIFIIFWYQFFCGFTGNVMIDQIYLMIFNVLFTSLPPIILGIFDRDSPDDLLLHNPNLYTQGRKSEVYTKCSFWVNMLDALYQSIAMFFIPYFAYYDSDVGIWEFGTTICATCVVVQLLHISIVIKSWTWLHVASILISLGIFFGFAVLYNYLCISSTTLQNPYWVIQHAMTTANFWFCIFLTPVVACLPRYVVQAVQTSLSPSPVTAALREQKAYLQSSDKSTVSVSWSRGSSGSSVAFKANSKVGNEDRACDEVPSVSASCGTTPSSGHSGNSVLT